MNISEAHEFLNFWINKSQGAYYPPEQIDALIDAGQIAFYNDIKPKYATSQLVKDILAPFRATYSFTTAISAYVIVPANTNYLDLLDLQIYFTVSDRTMFFGVPMVNEDVRAQRLNSQIDPVTVTSPIGEQYAPRTFRLYPQGTYNGAVTFLRRPVAPVFAYTIVSGRVIVYDANNSVQLEWRQTEITAILLKALASMGINLTQEQVSQFAETKTQENYQNVNRL